MSIKELQGFFTAEALVARIGSLPTMPQAAARALELLREPDTTADDLRAVIETDASLAAAVLRLANSSLFGPAQATAKLSHAIMLIGFYRLRSLTLASVVSGLRSLTPDDAAAEHDMLWNHALDAALAARALGERAGLEWSEEAFVAGLMHDCGRQILLVLEPELYCSLIHDAGGRLPSVAREKEAMGVSHEDAGAALMRLWKMAPQVVQAVGSHHGPGSFEGQHGGLVALVALADRIMEPSEEEESLEEPLALLDMQDLDPDELRHEVQESVTAARPLFLAL